MNKNVKQQKEELGSKERIIEAAWTLFYDKGYDATTVDDIIALSGTSKGTFYYYFSAKDVLLTTLSDLLDEYYQELAQSMEQEKNSMEKLLWLNYKAHKMIEQKISLDLLTSLYATQLTAKGPRHLLDQNRYYYQLILQLIEEGQKRGEIRNDKSIHEIAKYYAMCERAIISDWCLNQGGYALGDYSKEYMPIMMEHFRCP